jgi:hypothetical protein
MTYDIAINKAWEELAELNPDKNFSVKFLADEYNVDLETRKVLSLSCNVAAKDFTTILLLHYLIQKTKGLPALTGEWLTFRELSGIEGYYPAFKKRAIEPIIRKYGSNPQGLLQVLDRLPAKRVMEADVAIVLGAFEGVPVLIKLWRGDEEFGPDANMLFDRSVTQIFCTEDIVVLAGFVAASL